MDYIKTKLVRNGEVEKSAPPDELLKALEKVAADYGYILDDTELSDSPGWRKNPVATITVTGPVQCGKSIVMLRLARILEEEFGAKVVLDDGLRAETNLVRDWVDVIDKGIDVGGSNFIQAVGRQLQKTIDLKKWERTMVARTTWNLRENPKDV